jgi:hypothetical protein
MRKAHEKATDWVEERKRLSKRAREREREKNKSRSQDLKLAGVNVASLASRICCRRRRPPAPSVTNF